MSHRERRFDRGRRTADDQLDRLARELRSARSGAGLSQRTLAAAAGISPSQLSRLERAGLPNASVRVYAVLFALVGHTLAVRAYPDGPPARDVAHVRLLRRLARALPPKVSIRTEVPLRRPGDLRAWDAELRFVDGRCMVEAETVISDIQALERRVALKMADDGVDRVILLIADTRRNRAALAESGPALVGRFPLGSREVLRALREGSCPEHGGVVIL